MATHASDSIRQKPRTAPADELAVIVQRAQSFTGASGAAVAISEGNSDEIVCRARSGSSAPDVGTALRVEGSFTGICIQTGKELRCDDAETDTRVDTTAIRALGIRSMVVTPIRDEGRVVGVLAVFAPTPHTFTITHVAVLKTMSDQISALLQKERRAKDEPHFEPPSPPAPVVVSKPPASSAAPKTPLPTVVPKPPAAVPLPPPVVIKPAAPAPAAAAAAAPAPVPVPLPAPVRPSVASTPRVETEAVSLAADISAPAPFSKKEEKREYRPEPSPATRTNFGTLDAVAGEPQRSSAGKLIIVGVVVLAVAAGAAWFFLSKKSPASSSSSSVQSQPAPQQNSSAAATATAAPAATVSSNAGAADSTGTTASSTPASSAKTNSTEKKSELRKKEVAQAPEPAPSPATVALAGGPSKIARSTPADQSPDVSPSLAVGGSSAGRLASLTRPVGTAAPSMLTQSDLVNAKAIHTVQAVYPELAKARRLSGTVVVKVMVGKDGKTRNPVFVSGPILFRDAAFDAVKQWTFQPAQLNGQAIEQETDIRVKFTPN